MNSNKFTCTIHGSYRKHLEIIRQVAELFSLIGVDVLCPRGFKVLNKQDEFIRFAHDTGSPEDIEASLLEILRSNRNNPNFFAYFVDVDGYIGPSSSYELSMVRELNISYYVLENPNNIPIRLEDDKIFRPTELARKILFSSAG